MATTDTTPAPKAAGVPERVVYRGTRPGPIELVAEGFRDIWSRRRLARYLVQADLKKKGSDTLLGNIWWVLDPLLQMVVYVASALGLLVCTSLLGVRLYLRQRNGHKG